jgi:hypothetical protein
MYPNPPWLCKIVSSPFPFAFYLASTDVQRQEQAAHQTRGDRDLDDPGYVDTYQNVMRRNSIHHGWL